MKKLFALTAAAVALIATGCNKEAVSQDGPDAETPGVKVRRTLTAVAPAGTRTALDEEGVEILWQEGDAITVFGAETKKPYVFTIAADGIGKTTATFEGEMDADDASGSFYAVYPALSVRPESLRDGKIEILDALGVQTGVSRGFDPRSAVLTGTISGNKVTFRHGMAYFKLTIGSEDVTSIRLESSKISFDGRPAYETTSGNAVSVSGGLHNAILRPASGDVFGIEDTYYIPVLATGDELGTLTVTYNFVDGSYGQISTNAKETEHLVPGRVYNLGKREIVAAPLSNVAHDVVTAEMSRNYKGANYLDNQNGKYKWNYTTGLELKAMLDVYAFNGDNTILNYVNAWYNYIIKSDGTPDENYKMSDYSSDHICPGRTLFQLYDITGVQKYRKALDKLYEHIKGQPRNAYRGFYHKRSYENEMWLDGLYMLEPFYAQYTRDYIVDGAERKNNFEDIALQFSLIYEHTYDAETHLLRHAWDASLGEKERWCANAEGQSSHAWGRAMGWYAMALVDVIEILTDVPEAQKQRDTLIDLLKKVYAALPYGRDKVTGMWFQVLDRPYQERNYVEATASAMFVYSWLKGCRLGILEDVEGARVAYKSLLDTFVTYDGSNRLVLKQCCAVAGLGGNPYRMGDYDYYVSQDIVENDPKGIGPLIWAALEYNK